MFFGDILDEIILCSGKLLRYVLSVSGYIISPGSLFNCDGLNQSNSSRQPLFLPGFR